MTCDLRTAGFCFAVLFCLSGCGRRDGLTEINGTVTYDGQPVQKGTISLLPTDGRGPTAAAVITGGKYSVKIAPGPKQIKIQGFKVTGQERYKPNDPTSPMVDIQEQILPERYNAKSDLTRDIASGGGTLDFALEK